MMRVVSIWNKRPDLGEVQYQMVSKFADTDIEFVVGTAATGKMLKAIEDVANRHPGIRIVELDQGTYKENVKEFMRILDIEADRDMITWCVEEDISPTKVFGWTGQPRASIYRGKSLRCWKGYHSATKFDYGTIPVIRVFAREQLPDHFDPQVVAAYRSANLLAMGRGGVGDQSAHYMELFDGHWLHYDKASYARKGDVNQTKDIMWEKLCLANDVIAPPKWMGRKAPDLPVRGEPN